MTPMTTMSLSPSKIGKFQEMFGAALRKDDNLFDEEAQSIIENDWDDLKPELESACVAAINKVRERKRNTIVVVAKKVDYNRTPRKVISATGRVEYLDSDVVSTMLRRTKGVVENLPVVFFKLGRPVTAEELEHEYEQRNLTPDPYAQSAVNEEDLSFADKYPNGTQWGRDGTTSSCLTFDRWDDWRNVNCGRDGGRWVGSWWFAGVRKF